MDESAAIAIMARLDIVRDDVSSLKESARAMWSKQSENEVRMDCLDSSLSLVGSTLKGISSDITLIKNGPVYSLDRFITKRVAQTTGGLGLVGFFFAYVFGMF